MGLSHFFPILQKKKKHFLYYEHPVHMFSVHFYYYLFECAKKRHRRWKHAFSLECGPWAQKPIWMVNGTLRHAKWTKQFKLWTANKHRKARKNEWKKNVCSSPKIKATAALRGFNANMCKIWIYPLTCQTGLNKQTQTKFNKTRAKKNVFNEQTKIQHFLVFSQKRFIIGTEKQKKLCQKSMLRSK